MKNNLLKYIKSQYDRGISDYSLKSVIIIHNYRMINDDTILVNYKVYVNIFSEPVITYDKFPISKLNDFLLEQRNIKINNILTF